MAWTLFWDMHSGGYVKVPPYDKIYIELPEQAAIAYFENRFNQSPDDIACSCCGENFSVSEEVSLEEATDYHRYEYTTSGKVRLSLEVYRQKETVLIIPFSEIEPKE